MQVAAADSEKHCGTDTSVSLVPGCTRCWLDRSLPVQPSNKGIHVVAEVFVLELKSSIMWAYVCYKQKLEWYSLRLDTDTRYS